MRVGTLYPEICSRARFWRSAGIDLVPVGRDEHRGDLFFPFRVRHTEDERVEHFVERLEEQLHLARRDVRTLRLDHLRVAPDEVGDAFVHEHAVAGVEPAVLVEDLFALLLVVAVHEPVAANPQLALFHVGLDRSGVGIDTDALDAA